MFLHTLNHVFGPTPEACFDMLNLIRHYIFCILWSTARDMIFLLLFTMLTTTLTMTWLLTTTMDSSEYIALTVFALKNVIYLCTIDRAYIIPPCLEEEIYPVGNLTFGGRGPGISQRTGPPPHPHGGDVVGEERRNHTHTPQDTHNTTPPHVHAQQTSTNSHPNTHVNDSLWMMHASFFLFFLLFFLNPIQMHRSTLHATHMNNSLSPCPNVVAHHPPTITKSIPLPPPRPINNQNSTTHNTETKP